MKLGAGSADGVISEKLKLQGGRAGVQLCKISWNAYSQGRGCNQSNITRGRWVKIIYFPGGHTMTRSPGNNNNSGKSNYRRTLIVSLIKLTKYRPAPNNGSAIMYAVRTSGDKSVSSLPPCSGTLYRPCLHWQKF